MISVQQWLDANYSKEERTVETKLLITDQLTGTLDLTDFTKLKKIFIAQSVDVSQFQITNQPVQVEIINNSWIDIHKKFVGKEYGGKTWQQYWEEAGLTARAWKRKQSNQSLHK